MERPTIKIVERLQSTPAGCNVTLHADLKQFAVKKFRAAGILFGAWKLTLKSFGSEIHE